MPVRRVSPPAAIASSQEPVAAGGAAIHTNVVAMPRQRATRKAECRGRAKASCVRTRACTFVSSTKMRDHCRARPVRRPRVREEPMTVAELNDPANINAPFLVSVGAPLKMRIETPV